MGTIAVQLTADMGDPVTVKRVNLTDGYMKGICFSCGSAAQRGPWSSYS